jgi:transcriptional regulator EpsA
LNGNTTTYFSFSQIPGRLTTRHAQLLEMLVPHLHVALIRAIKGLKNSMPEPAILPFDLTEREQEILQWLGSGKTNWEIAQQLSISENTVKNHVQRILAKLDVKTRAQAVAKALNPVY